MNGLIIHTLAGAPVLLIFIAAIINKAAEERRQRKINNLNNFMKHGTVYGEEND